MGYGLEQYEFPKKTCLYCGKKFYPLYYDNFCSQACLDKYKPEVEPCK